MTTNPTQPLAPPSTTDQIRSMQLRITTLEGLFGADSPTVATFRTELDAFIASTNAQFGNVNNRLQQLERKAQGITRANAQVARTDTRLALLVAEIESLKARIETGGVTPAQAGSRIDVLEARFGPIETALADHELRISGLEAESPVIASELQRLSDGQVSHAGRLNHLEVAVGELRQTQNNGLATKFNVGMGLLWGLFFAIVIGLVFNVWFEELSDTRVWVATGIAFVAGIIFGGFFHMKAVEAVNSARPAPPVAPTPPQMPARPPAPTQAVPITPAPTPVDARS